MKDIALEQFSRLIEFIKSYENHLDNWNKAHALPIDKSAITRTIRLMHILKRENLLKHYEVEREGEAKMDLPEYQIGYGSLGISPMPEGGIRLD